MATSIPPPLRSLSASSAYPSCGLTHSSAPAARQASNLSAAISTAITFACEDKDCLVRARRNLYFMHKYELQQALQKVPDGANLLIDLSSTNYVDLDNIDLINAFIKGASYRGISVVVRGDLADRSAPLINAPPYEVRFA